jgi:nicotinamidase-related amidase
VKRPDAHAHARRLRLPTLPASPVVLLLIDFINPLRFDGAQRLRAPAIEAARATAQLRHRARAAQAQTIYANDNYGVWRSDFKDLWMRCSASGGASGAISRALRPRADDFTILKPRHSAFYSTPLELLLKQLKCRRLILAGIAADNCVLFTAMDAYLRGYELWIPQDCVAAESVQAKRQALDQMRRVLKAHTRAACEPR